MEEVNQKDKQTTEKPFEEAMNELEQIVEMLESGDIPLEQAIELFQKGTELSKTCHEKLSRIEKQVHMLMEKEGELVKKEFVIEEELD